MQPHGGEVKKAILFPAGWKTRGEDRETRLGTRTGKEGLARFTSNATIAAGTALVPTAPTLVTPKFTHLRLPLLFTISTPGKQLLSLANLKLY